MGKYFEVANDGLLWGGAGNTRAQQNGTTQTQARAHTHTRALLHMVHAHVWTRKDEANAHKHTKISGLIRTHALMCAPRVREHLAFSSWFE